MDLNNSEKKVLESFNEKQLVNMLSELIKIPSQNPPGEEEEIAEYCARRCRNMGMDVKLVSLQNNRHTVIATLKGTKDKPVLLYHAHLDTVPIGDTSKWKFDPFGGEVSNGKIYGRGACDTKNDIAAMIHVAEMLIDSRVNLEGNLVLCFAPDEETGGRYGTEYAFNQGYFNNVDMVVAGEQTDLKVAIAEKGVANLVIRTKGTSAHASQIAENTVNAINKMGKIICAIDNEIIPALKYHKHKLLGSPTYNLGIIEGGVKPNVVAENCLLRINCRYLPGQREEDILHEFEYLIENLKQKDPDLNATVQLRDGALPFEIEESAPLVQYLRKAITKIKNVDSGVAGYYPGSDGRFFIEKGIPTVVFGPGSALQAHTTDEYVEIGQLMDSAKILAVLAVDILSS